MIESGRETPLLIVPGLGGSSVDHWQSHWERSRPFAKRVSQLDWDRPNLRVWLEQLRAAVERTPGAVLIGHSLGCVLIAQLARRYPGVPVGGALFVAPADVDFSERLPADVLDFAPTPLGPLPFAATVVASTNDPYMSIARARELSQFWGAAFVNVGACGHINVESGFGPWRTGERILDEFLNRIRRDDHAAHQRPHRQLARG